MIAERKGQPSTGSGQGAHSLERKYSCYGRYVMRHGDLQGQDSLLLAGKISRRGDFHALNGQESFFYEAVPYSGELALRKGSIQFLNIGHCSL